MLLLCLFLTVHFKILFMDKTILSAYRINQSIYWHILFPNRCRHTLIPSRLIGDPIPKSISRHSLFSDRSVDTRYSQIHLSAQLILQSICRHTLFPNQSLDTAYPPLDLPPHAIPKSISRHSLFSNRSVDTPYSQIDLSHTLIPNLFTLTLSSPVVLDRRPAVSRLGGNYFLQNSFPFSLH
jgi:hypothetical protein